MSHLYKQKSTYWLAYSIRGKLYRESLKTKDKATARYLQAKRDQLLAEGKCPVISSKISALDALAEYERDTLHRKAKNTHAEDVSRVRAFLAWASLGKLSTISAQHLTEYLNHRMSGDRPIGPRTANHIIIQVGAFTKYALQRGYLQSNPIAGFKAFRVPENPPRFLPKDEIARVLAAAKKEDLYPAVACAIYTGMRKGEIISLDWQDIDWAQDTITIRNKADFAPKSRRFRVIPLHHALKAILGPYRRKEGRCFDTINHRRSLDRIFRRAGVKKPGNGWHLLRHSWASHMLMSGADIVTVSRILGHRDLSTTQIYAHLAKGHISEAVERLEF